MNLAAKIPLLAGLNKVDLARLLGDTEDLSYPPGTVIVMGDAPSEWVYFLVEGEVQIGVLDGDSVVPLSVMRPGDLFGESGLLKEEKGRPEHVLALSEVRVVRLPLKRFVGLLSDNPAVARAFAHRAAEKTSEALGELSRVKRMLSAYMDEVWSSVPPLETTPAAGDMAYRPQEGVPYALPSRLARKRTPKQGSKFPSVATLKKFSWLLLGSVLALGLYWWQRGTPQVGAATAVLTWAAWNWLLGTIPDYVTALTAGILIVLTGITTAAVAFSGFANPSWFLLLGVLGIGVAVSQSGLLYRIALHMLRLLPQTYRGQSFALALTGLLFTPLLPSANSRSALASPLARELSEAMRFPPLSRGSAGLAMASFLGFGQMYFLFMNGTNICLLAWSLLPASARQEISWISWLGIALPLGLLTFAGCYLAILYLFPPEQTTGVSRRTITAQLRVLGPLTGTERTTAVVLFLVLLGFVTQAFHGLDPAWVALGGFSILVVLGVIDKNSLKAMDWSFLLLVGGLISLSEVTKVTGLTGKLTALIAPVLVPLGSSPYLFLGAVALLMLGVRLAVPIQQAVLVMVIALLPVATAMGYHPFIIVLVVLALSNSWILPQQNSMYLTVHSGTEERCFSHRQVRLLALVHSVIGVLAVLASVPLWRYMGLVPR